MTSWTKDFRITNGGKVKDVSKTKSDLTKDELLLEIANLQAENAELREELNRRNAALFASAEEGWIISSPNQAYTGVTAGVEFRNGTAFVPEGVKDALLLVSQLVNDFGYSAERSNAKDFQASKKAQPVKKGTSLEDLMRQPAVLTGT
jgi:hypothetical protein